MHYYYYYYFLKQEAEEQEEKNCLKSEFDTYDQHAVWF